jgi:peptide/nickel transport system permease protein
MPLRYLGRRLLQVIPMILTVVVLNFILIHLTPGDPASALAGQDAPQSYIDQLNHEYGLDKPIIVQLLTYIGHLFKADFGYSFSYQQSVLSIILSRLPATLLLVSISQILSIALGTMLGAVAARYNGRITDRIISFLTLTLYSIPVFWTGMVLIMIFALKLGWFPSSGMTSYAGGGSGSVGDVIHHLVLPVVALTAATMPVYARLTRAAAIEVMGEDFVTTSHAIGYPSRRIFYNHVLRNALLPTVTQAGLSMGFVFAGALLTETVFAWPGMGQLMYQAVFQRDYPLLMGIFVLTALCVALAMIVTDLVYAVLDPRVRYE